MCRSCSQMEGSNRQHMRCDSPAALAARFEKIVRENHPEMSDYEVAMQAADMARERNRELVEAGNRRRRIGRQKRRAVAATLETSADIPVALREPLAKGARACNPSQLQSYLAGVSDLPGVEETMRKGFSTDDKIVNHEEADRLNLNPEFLNTTVHYTMDDMPGTHMATLHDVRYTNSSFDRYSEDGRPVKDDFHFRNYEIQSRRLDVENALVGDEAAMDEMFGRFADDDTSPEAIAGRARRAEFEESVRLRNEMNDAGVFRYFDNKKNSALTAEERATAQRYMAGVTPQQWAAAEGSSRAIETYSTFKAAEQLDATTARRATPLSDGELSGSVLDLARAEELVTPGQTVNVANGMRLRRTDSDEVPFVFDVKVSDGDKDYMQVPVTPNMFQESMGNIIDRTPYVTGLEQTRDASRQDHSGTRQLVERTMRENSPAAKAARDTISRVKLGEMMGMPYSTGQVLLRRNGLNGAYYEGASAGKKKLKGRATALTAAGTTGEFSDYRTSGTASEWTMAMTAASQRARVATMQDVATQQGMASFNSRLSGNDEPISREHLADYMEKRQETKLWASTSRFTSGHLASKQGKLPANRTLARMVRSGNQALATTNTAERSRLNPSKPGREPMAGVAARTSVESLTAQTELYNAALAQRADHMAHYKTTGKHPVKTISIVHDDADLIDPTAEVGSSVKLRRNAVGYGRKDKMESPNGKQVRYYVESCNGLSNGSAVAHVAGFDNLTVTRKEEDADGNVTIVLTSDDVLESTLKGN